MKSTCFICSLPSHEFDKLANDVRNTSIYSYTELLNK